MIYAGTKNGIDYGFYLENEGLQNVFELTDEEHTDLLEGQSTGGKIIVFHSDKKPTLEDPPAPTPEELAETARAKRDRLIEDIMWRVERYQTQKALGVATADTEGNYRAVLTYLEELRNVPEQAGFPNTVQWPVLAV